MANAKTDLNLVDLEEAVAKADSVAEISRHYNDAIANNQGSPQWGNVSPLTIQTTRSPNGSFGFPQSTPRGLSRITHRFVLICAKRLSQQPKNKKANHLTGFKRLILHQIMARPERFERPTPWFVVKFLIVSFRLISYQEKSEYPCQIMDWLYNSSHVVS